MLSRAQQPLCQFLVALLHYLSFHFQVAVSAALAGEWGNLVPILHFLNLFSFNFNLLAHFKGLQLKFTVFNRHSLLRI